MLELTALPSLDEERWVPLVRATDVLLVEGGDAAYLCHWMRASGLADLLHQLLVPRALFMACQRNGFTVTSLKVLATYDEPVEVDGATRSSTAVSVRVGATDGTTTAQRRPARAA